MMNSLALLFTLLPTLLIIIEAGVFLYILAKHFQNMHQTRLLNVRMKKDAVVLPVRLHAYERVVLLLERITPSNLLLRVSGVGQTAADYHRVLLTEIRNEFNHNMSQQVYMSDQIWQQVKQTREEVVNLINKTYQEMPENARGNDLAKRILETILVEERDPTARAILAVKEEMREIF
ncbi:hypothetical protein ACFSKU_03250 [Pontibacter silvestris]|uniref:Uncharacterized protein n=1 Tax=Pontibacter silvestris TaxID=2305183 RepID=A0ABW4WSZ5_9BACT|nr:hypothetical protein [Pontibacter silvestris]MCC9138086.1 hypothetical protein [Pontibacter silvestris]